MSAGPNVALVRPSAGDAEEFAAAVRASRTLHGRWVAAPADAEAYASYVARLGGPDHDGFLLRHGAAGTLAGVVNLNNIVYGSLRSAYLGYYAFAGGEGRGLLTEGVGLVVSHAFGRLGLHRVEADIQPGNERSRRLAARLGFRNEGVARRLLYIGGDWRDHERWAVLREDWAWRPGADLRD
ncbi:MAG TPA: GNAT family protein [Acidimicrobiales bacterium]|nr:GNAT family protein [Acidimicrobiales bacterium]